MINYYFIRGMYMFIIDAPSTKCGSLTDSQG